MHTHTTTLMFIQVIRSYIIYSLNCLFTHCTVTKLVNASITSNVTKNNSKCRTKFKNDFKNWRNKLWPKIWIAWSAELNLKSRVIPKGTKCKCSMCHWRSHSNNYIRRWHWFSVEVKCTRWACRQGGFHNSTLPGNPSFLENGGAECL